MTEPLPAAAIHRPLVDLDAELAARVARAESCFWWVGRPLPSPYT